MKKIFIIMILIITINSHIYAYSEKFSQVISTIGLNIHDEQGKMLNEEIYLQYNQFVYGSPLDITNGQRWKNVSNGLWTKNGGAWKGKGIRGEYWVLGFNEAGKEIHNHKFPVDIEPPTPPTAWRYVALEEATASWENVDKYLYKEQKEYMQKTKLTRNGRTYDLTAIDIGLEKAVIENYATWLTNGNIYTRRYDKNNKEWAANFIIPPMAVDAKFEAILNLPLGTEYVFDEIQDSIEIPIEFGAEVSNLNKYTTQEQIENICAKLFVDGVYKDECNNNKTKYVIKENKIIIDRKYYGDASHIEVILNCEATLETSFVEDGILKRNREVAINIKLSDEEEYMEVRNRNHIIDKEKPKPKIDEIIIRKQTKKGDTKLYTSKITNTKFICAGQTAVIQVNTSNNVERITFEIQGNSSISTFDDITKKFEWYDAKERRQKTRYSTLHGFEIMYDLPLTVYPSEVTDKGTAEFKCFYLIPYKTKQTLHSWSSLREECKDAFEIDESRLFERICKPYMIKIKAYSSNGVTTSSVNIDVFERWDTLYNRDVSKYVK